MTPEDIKRIEGMTVQQLQKALRLAIDYVWPDLESETPVDLDDLEILEGTVQALLYKLRNPSQPQLTNQDIAAQIAKAVWEGEVDGLQTRHVAQKWGIATTKALKILQSIVKGENKSFPFEYDAAFEGVRVKDGTCFVWGENADYSEGHGTRHHIWFYL